MRGISFKYLSSSNRQKAHKIEQAEVKTTPYALSATLINAIVIDDREYFFYLDSSNKKDVKYAEKMLEELTEFLKIAKKQ